MAGENWSRATIGSLIDSGAILAHKDGNYGSFYPRVEEFGSNGIPFLTAKLLHDGHIDIEGAPRLAEERAKELPFGFVETDDVLLSHNATIGRVAIVPKYDGPLLVGTSLTYFRLNKQKLLPRYFATYLSGFDFQSQLAAVMSHSTRNQVPISAQRGLRILIPPLEVQETIASILGALDDKIELNRRTNETLEAMARALFKSWFVDFDPVRAKAAGRKPPGLDAETAALFPDSFQNSPLGKIPKGWESGRLDEIASVEMGLSPDGDSYNSDGIGVPLINGPVEFGEYFPVKSKWTQAPTRLAAPGDLIFCVRGSTTGRRVVSDGEYCIGRGVCAIRAMGDCHGFLYQTIESGLDRLLEKTTGSVFPSLSAPDIKGFPVVRPNDSILDVFARLTNPLILRIQHNHHECRTLTNSRDSLLPKLLSGEIAARTSKRNE